MSDKELGSYCLLKTILLLNYMWTSVFIGWKYIKNLNKYTINNENNVGVTSNVLTIELWFLTLNTTPSRIFITLNYCFV